ncbi:hypothetical protein [Caballeronia sordidicola]|nr:hypothetical protein [Caballeronia sordidicola]
MKVLIAVSAAKRLHVLQPEVAWEFVDPMYRLFEAVLDLEAQPIQANEFDGIQAEVGTNRQAGPPCQGESLLRSEQAVRTPAIVDRRLNTGSDVVLAIDSVGGLL